MDFQLLFGFLLGLGVGAVAWRARALTYSGAVAAALSGGLIFGLGGLPWAILLLSFFISSSALSRLAGEQKGSIRDTVVKGAQRDWGQVLANGGVGTVLVLLSAVLPASRELWIAYAGSLAAVNADTWATELGLLSPSQPRLITSGQRVPPGTSGGVTRTGLVASLMGAVLIGLLGGILDPGVRFWTAFSAIAVAGLAGSAFDSLLGATVQALYTCPSCEKVTERHPVHTCGAETSPLRGWPWLNNDLVNVAASGFGAGTALSVWWVFSGIS